MKNFTFLTDKQVYTNYQLEIIKKYGRKSTITDFAILLGGNVSSNCYVGDEKNMKDRSCIWWTISPYENGSSAIDFDGVRLWVNVAKRDIGARPAISCDYILPRSSNFTREKSGILEVEYGEYPQDIVSLEFAIKLENEYLNKNLLKTGKYYTADSVGIDDYETTFKARRFFEYEYNGRKFIRFIGDSNCVGKVLSDGRIIQEGEPYWVEVKSIKWMIEEKENIAISKKVLFSGIQFSRTNHIDFDKTTISSFMNKCFSKDIVPSTFENINQEEISFKKQK